MHRGSDANQTHPPPRPLATSSGLWAQLHVSRTPPRSWCAREFYERAEEAASPTTKKCRKIQEIRRNYTHFHSSTRPLVHSSSAPDMPEQHTRQRASEEPQGAVSLRNPAASAASRALISQGRPTCSTRNPTGRHCPPCQTNKNKTTAGSHQSLTMTDSYRGTGNECGTWHLSGQLRPDLGSGASSSSPPTRIHTRLETVLHHMRDGRVERCSGHVVERDTDSSHRTGPAGGVPR